jgi:hypothetical protein
VTASPTVRLIAKATQGGEVCDFWRESGANRTPTGAIVRKRRPSVARRSKTARSRTDQIRPTAWRGPCRGAPSGRPDRRGLTSAGGTRASWTVSGCSVERCASPMPPRPHQYGGRQTAAKTCRRRPHLNVAALANRQHNVSTLRGAYRERQLARQSTGKLQQNPPKQPLSGHERDPCKLSTGGCYGALPVDVPAGGVSGFIEPAFALHTLWIEVWTTGTFYD